MFKRIILLCGLLLSSCSGVRNSESPMLYFSNASQSPIKNIRCEWAKNNVLTLPALVPGASRSQSFYMRSAADFFGLVKVSWINAAGDDVTREFYFRENSLPSIKDHSTYNFVQIYFEQNDLEILSSASPDLAGKTSKMDRLLANYNSQYLTRDKVSTPVQSSLISVGPVKDNSVPNWINNYY